MVSRANFKTGRVDQKQRTRKALVDAAARLLDRGVRPRIAAVAAEAGISRATAYRYFASEDALLLEAPLAARTLGTDDVLPPNDLPRDAAERVRRVHAYFYDHAVENEMQFRMFLRAVHEAQVEAPRPAGDPPRAGRRIDMLERALEPLCAELDPETYDRLRYALSMLIGVESMLVMKDVCGLSPERGREITGWAAQTLLRAVGAHGSA